MYLFLERWKGREKEKEIYIDVQEKHPLVASHMPPTGDLAHDPGKVPYPGIEPAIFWFAGQHSIH